MIESKTIEGRWLLFGNDKESHCGVLTYEPEIGLNLAIEIKRNKTFSEAYLSPNANKEGVAEVIYGFDNNRQPITLFGCCSSQCQHSRSRDTYHISANRALIGERVTSWNDANYRAVSVEFNLLNEWMGFQVLCKTLPVSDFQINSNVLLRIARNSSKCSESMGERQLMNNVVCFVFTTPLEVNIILRDYIHALRNLLSLIIGHSVFIEKVVFHDSDPFQMQKSSTRNVEMLKSSPNVNTCRGILAPSMLTSYEQLKTHFPALIRIWFERYKALEPVINLLYMTSSGQVHTIETYFLSLAQAFEVFHSRVSQFDSKEMPSNEYKKRLNEIVCSVPELYKEWLKKKLGSMNRKSLAQKIDEILSCHEKETSVLTHGITDFAKKILCTRNYLTHYGETLRENGKVAEKMELVRITFALEALIKIGILREVEIQGEPIARLVDRYSRMTFID